MVEDILALRRTQQHQQARPPFSRQPRRRATFPRLLHRPIFGDVFGAGRFALATRPLIARGLHAVQYLVIEPRRGQVLAVADEKGAVLAQARELILDAERQGSLWPELHGHQRRPARRAPSRRRREVFSRSGGRCCYCREPLQLDGSWHVEHQLPRALGGDGQPLNLVAACPACNLRKADRSALEFVAEPGRE